MKLSEIRSRVGAFIHVTGKIVAIKVISIASIHTDIIYYIMCLLYTCPIHNVFQLSRHKGRYLGQVQAKKKHRCLRKSIQIPCPPLDRPFVTQSRGQTIITSSNVTSNKYRAFCEARQELWTRYVSTECTWHNSRYTHTHTYARAYTRTRAHTYRRTNIKARAVFGETHTHT